MKRILFSIALIICAAIVSGTVVKAELPPMPSGGPPLPSLPDLPDISRPSYSPTPTPPDVNERRWERWWIANRAPLLVQFDPRIGETFKEDEEKDPQPTKSSYMDTDDKPKKRIPSAAVGAKKLNVLQLLVLLGYAGKFKEISRAMVLDELEYRGKDAVKELISIAKGEAGGSPVSGISARQLQHYAIIALGEIASEEVYEPLVEIYKETEKQDTVFFASLALGRHGDEKAAEVIINGRDGLDQYQRAAACLSLAMMGAVDKADFIKEVFKTAPSNEEKVFSALSLGVMGSVNQKDVLKEWYEKSPDPFVKAMAAWAFIAHCEEKSADPDLIIEGLVDADPFVQTVAMLTAGTKQYRSKLGIIKKIANETEQPRVRRAALLALAMSNSKTGFKLLNELKDKGGDMAKEAEFALSLMKSKTRKTVLNDWMRMPKDMMELAPFIMARYEGEETMSRIRRGKSMKLGMDPVFSVLAYGLVFAVCRRAMRECERRSDDE